MRTPAVAGMFYPGNGEELRRLIGQLTPKASAPRLDAMGVVVPHAGYVYSGGVAAKVYSSIEGAPTFIILGPRHSWEGSAIAVSTQPWKTPLGVVDVDHEFIDLLPPGIIDHDEVAHRREHSIEVQVPFLQYFFKDFKIVPIALGLQDYETAREVAGELTAAIEKYPGKVVIVASSDFTHYEPAEVAKRKDGLLIERIEKLDVPGLYDEISSLNATCCGYGPIAAMMLSCKRRGAAKARLLAYATSGDVTGDREVVGYAGLAVVKG
jgi:AmmeMemoRadiSam system protein B